MAEQQSGLTKGGLSVWVALYLILSIGFSLAPIFEGHDELEHYRYARTIAHTGQLPPPDGQPLGEYHQAPLYYALSAPVLSLIDDPAFEDYLDRKNPFYANQHPATGDDNKSRYIHAPQETFPYTGSGVALALHLMRLSSVLMGLGVVLLTDRIAKLLWPGDRIRRWLLMSFVVLLPNFLHQSAIFNNDALLVFLATAALYLILRQQRGGPSLSLSIWLGVVLGAALLTKSSALALALPVGLAVLLDRRTWWPHAPLTLGITLTIAGWWYLRNMLLYGDPTNIEAMYRTWPDQRIPNGPDWALGWERMAYGYTTFWARFGGAVPVGEEIYRFFDLLTLVSLGGLLVWGGKWVISKRALPDRVIWQQSLVIAVYAGSWLFGLWYYSSLTWTGNQGRFLFPALAAYGVLFALGITAWLPQRIRWGAALTLTGAQTLIAGMTLFVYFLPAFTLKPIPAEIAHPLTLHYEDVAEVVGIEAARIDAQPGDIVQVRLYWRALDQGDGALLTYLQTLYPDNLSPGPMGRDSYPGAGKLYADEWQPGQGWAEMLHLIIPPDTEPQIAYQLAAGLYNPTTDQALTASAGDQEVVPIVGTLVVHGAQMEADPDYRLGDIIGLDIPTLTQTGTRAELCLRWTSLAATETDYHIFVHVLSETGELLTQADSVPKGGRYPTWAWWPGEQIEDCILLDLAMVSDTQWHIGLGVYDPQADLRLPLLGRNGERLLNDMLIVRPD